MAGTANTSAPQTIPVGTSIKQPAYTVAGTGTTNDGAVVPGVVLIDQATGLPVSPAQTGGAVVLNQASAAQTASGQSASLAVGTYRELQVAINITAVAGTTPSATFYLDTLGADGIWYTALWTSAAQTAAGQVLTSIGVGAQVNVAFGQTVRLRWTITGTTPSLTLSASIIGK